MILHQQSSHLWQRGTHTCSVATAVVRRWIERDTETVVHMSEELTDGSVRHRLTTFETSVIPLLRKRAC